MQGMNIDALVTQWDSEFDIWFNDINSKLGTEPATSLQTQVNAITAGTTLGPTINGLVSKTTPVNADMIPLMDSAASNATKKVSWTNIKTTLKTYFDTLYIGKSTSTGTSVNLVWAGTQAQYDAIGTKDANTLYCIV